MRAAPALRAAMPELARATLIVAVYTVVFFVLLPALLWTLGGSFDAAFAFGALGDTAHRVGVTLLGAGAALTLASMSTLVAKGRGLPISHLPPLALVARGVYARLRHPIYVGYTAVVAGGGLVDRSVGRGALAPLLLTACWLIYALGFEEPRLRARFGSSYAAYARATPLGPLPFASTLATIARRAWLLVRPAAEALARRTVLFRVGGSVWVTYGALVAMGGVAGAAAAAPLLAGFGLSPSQIALYELGLTSSMLVGGRVVWLAYEWRLVCSDPRVILRRVGFVSFGGYVGFLAFTLLFARFSGLPLLGLLDRTVPPAFLISAFGRLGCLSYGCCYGRPCRDGLRWTNPSAKVNRERGDTGSVPRIPTPLLSAALALSVSGIGFAVLGSEALPGAAAASALLSYGVLRFGTEHSRDEVRFGWAPFTRGQLFSVPMALAGMGAFLVLPHLGAAAARTPRDASVLGPLVPALVAIGALSFLVCGFHRREVGRW